ncbi:MAG TPA: HAMP domain-containing sensor histidine kinase [Bdellovibrionales bacterium]|nr:HAMP domain-containing sensor histidine kinase [Bdellovibrionales bacterium]
MTTSSKPEFLKSKRKTTDESLNAERNKATESIQISKAQKQKKTDEIVENTRSATDAARSQIDEAIAKERQHADKLVESVLASERQVTDVSLKVERDTTDSRAKESAEAHHETKIALASRDELLAIVSHDLRNPIGAVTSYASLLLENGEFKNLNPNAQEYVGAIRRSANVALRLISDLIDAEQIAQGKLQITIAPCDLIQIIRETIEAFRVDAFKKNIRLDADFPHDSIEIKGDGDRIRQILSNLIGNALKFTPEGGAVAVKATFDEKEVLVSIRDSGPGIPEDERERIFERFAQLKSKARNSLGLGLYISKTLVEAHHGRLWVDSKLGSGSTFYFTLPVNH